MSANWPNEIILALKRRFSRVNSSFTGALYDSFFHNNKVISQNVITKIAKTLHNIHWEERQRVLEALKRERVDVNVAPVENDDTDE